MKIKDNFKMLLRKNLYPKKTDKLNVEITEIQNELLTIVFWDVSGFSKLTIDLEAHTDLLTGFLQEYFEISIKIIREHGGSLDKFIGDGVMAIFGRHSQVNAETPAISAITAAIEFRKEFQILKNKWNEKIRKIVSDSDISQLALKCGINTGNVLCCIMKVEGDEQITALGTNVNLANRLCDFIDKPDRIIISSSSAYNVKNRFELLSLGGKPIHNMGTHEVFEVINTFNENELLPSLSKGSGTVTANIPREISIDSPSEVFAEFYGSVDLGFLTLKIQDHLNNDLWFVDPGSVKYEYDKDTGKNIDKGLLSFRNDRYSSKWKFNIQQELKTLKPGKGLATLGMFEIKDYKDKSGVLIRDRPHVDLVIEEIQLI